jgi:hypothetical protein
MGNGSYLTRLYAFGVQSPVTRRETIGELCSVCCKRHPECGTNEHRPVSQPDLPQNTEVALDELSATKPVTAGTAGLSKFRDTNDIAN